MTEKITYYASTVAGTEHKPSGLLRRTWHEDGTHTDQTLSRELVWRRSTGITEWEFGGVDLVEVTAEHADRVYADFRNQWSASDRYYVVVEEGGVTGDPSGLVRRLAYEDGYIEEGVLENDGHWAETNVITDWEAGERSVQLVEVSLDEVGSMIDRLQRRSDNQAGA